jgi:hypothetical protein
MSLQKSVCLVLVLFTALLGGCASTAPQAKFAKPMAADARIRASDTENVTLTAADTVKAIPQERDRVKQKIAARIDERKLTNPQEGAPRTFEVEVFVSRYEKGNAFGRALMPGVGQIHLDGTISVFQMPGHELLEQFDMQKTFAWGGIYGGVTTMETIEDTFADAVAATVTGQTPPKTEPDKAAAH